MIVAGLLLAFSTHAAPLAVLIGEEPKALADGERREQIQSDQFAALVALSKSPDAARDPELAALYRALPQLELQSRRRIGSSAQFAPDLTPAEKELAPAKQLELARARGNSAYAANESARLALEILRAHPDAVASLMRGDLRSDNAAQQERGLKNLTRLLLPTEYEWDAFSPALPPAIAPSWAALYPDVAAIFRNPSDAGPTKARKGGVYSTVPVPGLKGSAEAALSGLGDARGIALFIAEDPTQYYEAISRLARRTPGDPALSKLVPLLRAPDWRQRYAALSALPISDPELQRALPVLLDDANATISRGAASKAFELTGAPFEAVEAKLKTKLADPDLFTRIHAAIRFAKRKDPIAAPVLLAALRDHAGEITGAYVSAILNQLIGFDSGYDARSPVDDPDRKERNAVALARVEAWIAAHPVVPN